MSHQNHSNRSFLLAYQITLQNVCLAVFKKNSAWMMQTCAEKNAEQLAASTQPKKNRRGACHDSMKHKYQDMGQQGHLEDWKTSQQISGDFARSHWRVDPRDRWLERCGAQVEPKKMWLGVLARGRQSQLHTFQSRSPTIHITKKTTTHFLQNKYFQKFTNKF